MVFGGIIEIHHVCKRYFPKNIGFEDEQLFPRLRQIVYLIFFAQLRDAPFRQIGPQS